jgi:hypothetical protein
MPRHEFLRKDLAALETRSRASRPNNRESLCFEKINNAGRERRFRTYKRQINSLGLGKSCQLLVLINCDIHELCVLSDAGISRSTKHRDLFSRCLTKRPNDRVLPATRSDYECFSHRFP